MRLRASVVGFISGLIVGGAVAVGVLEYRWQHNREPVTTAQVFRGVLSAIRQSFVDSISDAELSIRAAKGIVATLNDPYAAVLGAEENRGYRNVLRGRGASIGMTVESGLTGLRVGSVIVDGPADDAGARPGQFIESINHKPSRQWSKEYGASAIRTDSAAVVLQLYSPNDSGNRTLEIVPKPGRVSAVTKVARLADDIGYIALGGVPSNASREIRDALTRLRARSLSTLVLDLRGNLGGSFEEALAVADLFLPVDAPIGAISKRNVDWPKFKATSSEQYANLSLVLLVDRLTASSAEIIAAALRDNGRAVLIGERTYGKGLIQTTIPLGDSIALRMTTGRWRTPTGDSIDGGLVPDSIIDKRGPGSLDPFRRKLVGHEVVLARLLAEIGAAKLSDNQSIDSLTLEPADLIRLRQGLLADQCEVTKPMLAEAQAALDREMRRLAATAARDYQRATRFALLEDPVIQAALVRAGADGVR